MRDAKLTEKLRTNSQLLLATQVERHVDQIRRLGGPDLLYWLAFTVTVAALGCFIADRVDEPKFLIPAVLLQIWVIVMHASHLYLRHALLRLDFSSPLLTLQTQLETIRQKRLRRFKWGLLTGQIVWWVPLFIVLFKGLADVDLYTVSGFMPQFMLINVFAGLLFIPVSLTVSRMIFGRFGTSSILQRVLDSVSGRDVQASLAFLKRLREHGTTD